jgi:Amt family ammonium transporter
MANVSDVSTLGATAVSSSGIDEFWHILGLSMIFMMQIGFTVLEVGSVNVKNTKNILTKNVVNICVSVLAWWAIGYGFSYGNTSNGMLGTSRFFMGCEEYPDRLDPPPAFVEEDSLAFVAHQWGFASTAATIVSGAVAERIKIEAFATCTFFMVGIIYPIIARAVWHSDGWASITSSEYGAIDFSGSGAVHITG